MFLFISILVYLVILMLFYFLITGRDNLNAKLLPFYGRELQEKLRNDDELKTKILDLSPTTLFIIKSVFYIILLFVLGIFMRSDSFFKNFANLFIFGQIVNLFDLGVIKLIYFRNSKRVRFNKFEGKELYLDAKSNYYIFLISIILFTSVAALDAALLLLF